MPKITNLLLVACLALAGSQTAAEPEAAPQAEPAAQTQQKAPQADRQVPSILRFRREIGLTEQQASAIERIHEESRAALQENRKRMRELRGEMRRILEQGYNERDVRRNAEAQGRLFGEHVLLRSRQQSRVRDILSEEQKIRFKSLLREQARQKHRQQRE